MSAGDSYLSFVIILFLIFTSIESIRIVPNSTTVNLIASGISGINGTVSAMNTSTKNRLDQGKEMVHDVFANMDRGTIIRGTIVFTGITGLILLYVGVKAFLLRGKRQPKRYTLITDPSSMEEPLFGAHDNEEDIEDDTLFARK